jgi:predicted nuclease of predicted toxin-antitoxin system
VAEQGRSSPVESRIYPHQFGLLIDENLTPDLVRIARRRGFRARHVNEVKLRTRSDVAVARFALREGLIVVTNNIVDFRKLYARRKLHPGLIFLAGKEESLSRANQATLLGVALDDILANDLVHEVVLVRLLADLGSEIDYELTRHALPPHS